MKQHLEDIDQTYFRHMRQALKYSVMGFLASLCCFIHAFVPDWFQTQGSDIFKKIIGDIEDKKD